MFRAAMAQDGDLGRSVKKVLESGQLVSDEVTSAVVAQRIEQPDCRSGFMLDGYPRTPGQASALDEILRKRGLELDAVLYFDVSDETAIDRLGGRLTCEKCGANYHVRNMPPREKGRCDRCGGALRQRADDSPETMRERLAVYARQTSALVEEYARRGLLQRIDANRDVEEVDASVTPILEELSAGSRT